MSCRTTMAAVTTGPSEQDRLDEMARRWQAAEDRLYPVVMLRPDAYTSAVTLVRAIADRLGPVDRLEDLVTAYDGSAALVADVVREQGIPTGGLDLALVAAAAFNLRYRDLRAANQREQAKARIRAAAAQGLTWVLLFESGRRHGGSSADARELPPYRRLDMRLADGFGVHASVTSDPSTGEPLYAVETVQLDPSTGDWLHDAEPTAEPVHYPTRTAWQQAADQLRGQGGVPRPRG